MATSTNNAEGGSNTTAATAVNTGGGSGDAFANVSTAGTSAVTFSNEQAAHGSLSYKFANSGTDTVYVEWLPATSSAAAFRGYLYLTSLPTAGNGFIRIMTAGGGTTLAHILITNANVRVQNTAGADIHDTANTPPTGQWLRFEGSISNGNTSTGTLNMDWYVGDSLTPISGLTIALTGQNFGTANIGRIRYGRTASFGTYANFYLDDLAVADSTTTYIGPASNVAPTVDAGSNQNVSAGATVNLSATANDSDGTITDYAWTFDFPTSGAPTLTDDDTATPSFTAGSAGSLYILRCTVTDDGSSTAEDTVEVRVPVTATTAKTPLPMDAVGSAGTWSNVGGEDTDGEALADSSDATYLESGTLTGVEQWVEIRMVPTQQIGSGALDPVRLATSTGTGNAVVRLVEGNTVRATFNQEIDSTPTDYTFNLSAPQVASISDWGNLRWRIGATS